MMYNCTRSLDLRQSSSCNALTNCLEMIVSTMEFDGRDFRKLCFQNLSCFGKHDVTSSTLAHAAKNHDMFKLVEVTILSQTVPKVDTDSFVDETSSWLLGWIFHCCLDQLQALSMALMLNSAHVWVRIHLLLRSFNSSSGSKFCCTALSQVHVRNTRMCLLGPRVTWGHGIQVQSNVAQLVDPTHQVAICVSIATTLTASH